MVSCATWPQKLHIHIAWERDGSCHVDEKSDSNNFGYRTALDHCWITHPIDALSGPQDSTRVGESEVIELLFLVHWITGTVRFRYMKLAGVQKSHFAPGAKLPACI